MLVKIGPVFPVENLLTDGNCAGTRLQFDDRRPFVMLHGVQKPVGILEVLAVQPLIYEVDLKAYQPDGRPDVDASASRLCDILDNGPRPCGGWKNPAGTKYCPAISS